MIKWFEKDRLLFTGSKEKNIKVIYSYIIIFKLVIMLKIYEFPEFWRDKNIEEEEEYDEIVRKTTNAMLLFQKNKQKSLEDSDEEDINKIRF